MDQSLLTILHLIKTKLQTLSASAFQLIKTLDNTTSEDTQEAEITSSKLRTLLNRLNTELNNYFRLSKEHAPDDISEITTVQLEAEDVLCELDIKINGRKKTVEHRTQDTNLNLSSRLPKLNLPEFDGDILNWSTFWDQFSSNIDNRKLTDVDKFLYLKASLKGEARKIIEGLEVTNKNYNIALTTLKNRYGKENHIIDAHYAALYRLKASTSIAEIRNTFNEIERHLRVLNSLGEDINHNHLRFVIMEKFPKEIIYEMKMKISTESIEEIRKCLETIITAKEDTDRVVQEIQEENYTTQSLYVNTGNKVKINKVKQVPQIYDEKSTQKSEKNYQNRNLPQSYDNGHKKLFKRKPEYREERNTENKRKRLQCIFCQGPHFNDQCKTVTTLKERISKLHNKCYKCFRKNHTAKKCRRVDIFCPHCQKKTSHNRALCSNLFRNKVEPTNTMMQLAAKTKTKRSVVLQTAVVNAKQDGNDYRETKCRVLLDSGSQRTYITQSVANKLNLPIEEETKLSIFTFGTKAPQIINSPVVKIKLLTRTDETLVLYANVVPYISQNVLYHDVELEQWKDKTILADDGSLSSRIDILIGNDYYHSIMNIEKIEIKENLYLVNSKFGWILSGEIKSKHVDKLSAITYFSSCEEIKLNKPDLPLDNGNVKALWDLESIGITDSPKFSVEEEAVKTFNETTKLINNRYTVSWPWIEYPPSLSTNFGLSFGRLVSLLQRLDSNTLLEYDKILKEQINQGIIEVVPKHNKEDEHPIHYLPHHCVYQKGKAIRIVYDASAKVKDNKSLNQCLYCGPMMLEDLTGLLIQFRYHQVALSADVEKAFLQIALHNKDRDVTRFLWIKDLTKPATEDNIICMRFCRVPFGIISSPFLLNATIKLHLSNNDKPEIRNMANNIYVDNLVTGTSSVEEALKLYKDSKEAFQQISMNLREWSSNSDEFMAQIPDTSKDECVKILGLDWDLKEDSLQLRFEIDSNANTKREVLRVIASIYDPCGFAAPDILPAKLFLQELWKNKIKWDTNFSTQMAEEWLTIRDQLDKIKEISIPRRYITNAKNNNYQLHCFTDASLKAYAAVVYIVNEDKISFVIGKSRLTPIKDQDNLKIPRLELLGALIGSRLIKFALNFLPVKITHQILWTDSQIVIEWYNSSKLLPPFVSKRIQEIKRNKQLIVRYVPSELNSADVATRSPNTPENKDKWLTGPQYLLQKPETWPHLTTTTTSLLSREDLSKEIEDLPEEIIEDDIEMEEITPTSNEKEIDETNRESEISELEKRNLEEVNLEEIKKIQGEYFKEETEGKETHLSRNLGLFLDIDGILRCKGRMKNANWSFDKRYPILLPKDSELTNKIIMETHNKNYHVGTNHTLSIIREAYWIPQGKRQVQKLLNKCPTCVKHGGGPYKLPPTPALPPERVNYSSPFTFTGVDYLGPILVNNGKGTEKRWICLFTCLAVRAIHLEIVQDLSATEGLRALRRMIATRGIPTLITSDNALQFKLMSEILSQPYCIENKIRWKFIPALAPWFGGFYERLVGIVKYCMKRTLQKQLLRDCELSTVIKEIEAVINTRPLTCVDNELDHILKPADFLTVGKCITVEATQDELLNQGTVTKRELVKGWKRALKIREEFKEIFSNRYLLSLRERYRHSHREPRVTSKLEPREGQVVQIKGNHPNREGWRVGKILKLIKGKDGLIRVAKIKVGNTEFIRSISHLYPIEMDEQETNASVNNPKINYNNVSSEQRMRNLHEDEVTREIDNISDIEVNAPEIETDKVVQESNETLSETNPSLEEASEETSEPTFREQRPKREAAVRALEKIKEWTQNLIVLL